MSASSAAAAAAAPAATMAMPLAIARPGDRGLCEDWRLWTVRLPLSLPLPGDCLGDARRRSFDDFFMALDFYDFAV